MHVHVWMCVIEREKGCVCVYVHLGHVRIGGFGEYARGESHRFLPFGGLSRSLNFLCSVLKVRKFLLEI